jgi:hypothetical protein
METIVKKSLEDYLKKLDRHPSAANFVRLVDEHVQMTAKNIFKFVLAAIPFQYHWAYIAIKSIIEDHISIETGRKIIDTKCPDNCLAINLAVFDSFVRYEESRRFSTLNVLDHDPGYYRISKEILIPVKPLTVVSENGKFTSVFACGWSDLKCLTQLRRRMLQTITEDAFLSLTDFADGPAEYLFFPKSEVKSETNSGKRLHQVWHRGEYELLSKAAMSELADTYLKGRELAKEMIFDELNRRSKSEDDKPPTTGPSPQKDFFG